MKYIFCLCFLISAPFAWAVQKAKIASPEVEIYSGADYDSEVMEVVHQNEVYSISDKTVGPFYKIRLKNGKIGYISDYEVDIEGKGRVPEKDLDQLFLEEEKRAAKQNNNRDEVDPEEEAVFGKARGGPTLQLINYHENTLGADQVADLIAVGYKSVSLVSWSVLGSFGAPQYYADKTGGSASGLQLWGDLGFSSSVMNMPNSEVRFGGSFFGHLSYVKLDTPARKYDLQDVTAGIALELAYMYRFRKSALDFGVKYYFDKTSYAGFGVSYLF